MSHLPIALLSLMVVIAISIEVTVYNQLLVWPRLPWVGLLAWYRVRAQRTLRDGCCSFSSSRPYSSF